MTSASPSSSNCSSSSGRVCCIVVCPNARAGANPTVGYHPFPPDDANLRRLWIAFVGPTNLDRFRWRGKYICSEHFQAAEVLERDGQKVLLEDSIPTIFSVEEDDDDEDMADELELKVEPEVAKVAAVELPPESMVVVEEIELRSLFCRICLSKHQSGMVPLSSRLHDRLLLDMILAVTGLKITSDGIVPNQICPGCVTKIDLAYNVREEFLQREKILRDMLAGGQLEQYYDAYGGAPVELVNQAYLSGLIAAAQSEAVVEPEVKKPKFEVLNVETIVPARIEETVIAEIPLDMVEEHLYEIEEEVISIGDDSTAIPDIDEDDEDVDSEFTNAESIYSDASDLKEEQLQLQQPDEDRVVKPVGKVEPTVTIQYIPEPVQIETVPKTVPESSGSIPSRVTPRHIRPTVMDPKACHICFTNHSDVASLEAHLKCHGGMIPYKCARCSADGTAQRIETLAGLNEHVGRHQFPFQCGFCDQRFSGEQALFTHMRATHDNEPEPESGYTCTTCGQQFAKRALFRHHMTRHEALEDERFKCKDCGRVFGSALLLRLHRKIHTGEWKGFVSSRAIPYGIISRKQHHGESTDISKK